MKLFANLSKLYFDNSYFSIGAGSEGKDSLPNDCSFDLTWFTFKRIGESLGFGWSFWLCEFLNNTGESLNFKSA